MQGKVYHKPMLRMPECIRLFFAWETASLLITTYFPLYLLDVNLYLKKRSVSMEKGKIVFLNGVTSAGKTSIVDAIQLRSEQFFYVVANDLFENTIGDHYLRENY